MAESKGGGFSGAITSVFLSSLARLRAGNSSGGVVAPAPATASPARFATRPLLGAGVGTAVMKGKVSSFRGKGTGLGDGPSGGPDQGRMSRGSKLG